MSHESPYSHANVPEQVETRYFGIEMIDTLILDDQFNRALEENSVLTRVSFRQNNENHFTIPSSSINDLLPEHTLRGEGLETVRGFGIEMESSSSTMFMKGRFSLADYVVAFETGGKDVVFTVYQHDKITDTLSQLAVEGKLDAATRNSPVMSSYAISLKGTLELLRGMLPNLDSQTDTPDPVSLEPSQLQEALYSLGETAGTSTKTIRSALKNSSTTGIIAELTDSKTPTSTHTRLKMHVFEPAFSGSSTVGTILSHNTVVGPNETKGALLSSSEQYFLIGESLDISKYAAQKDPFTPPTSSSRSESSSQGMAPENSLDLCNNACTQAARAYKAWLDQNPLNSPDTSRG